MGEIVVVRVSGREAAELGPAHPNRWRPWDQVADVFAGPADPDWAIDRDQVDQAPHDPLAP